MWPDCRNFKSTTLDASPIRLTDPVCRLAPGGLVVWDYGMAIICLLTGRSAQGDPILRGPYFGVRSIAGSFHAEPFGGLERRRGIGRRADFRRGAAHGF